MSTKKMLRNLDDALEACGFQLVEADKRRGGHVIIRVRGATGERLFSMSSSPTDDTVTVRNVVRDVRRYLGERA